MKDDTIKKCQFCRLANELDSEEIKFWSKKAGNYSPYPEMITCDSNYNLQNDKLILKEPELNDNSLEVKLTLGKDNSDKYVYYWASNPQKDIHKILKPYVPINDIICNISRFSEKLYAIKFHGKPVKIFPLRNSINPNKRENKNKLLTGFLTLIKKKK